MAKTNGDKLAELYALIQLAATRSGRALHDDAGPLLSAAGFHLQSLRMDHPELAGPIDHVTGILDRACECIREVSQELAPSPVLRGGLKNALERLAAVASARGVTIQLSYQIAAELPLEHACALYDAARAALEAAAGAFGATRIAISARGIRQISVKIADNGQPRGRERALETARRIAEAHGLLVTIATKRSTIVSIRYALRRPAGG